MNLPLVLLLKCFQLLVPHKKIIFNELRISNFFIISSNHHYVAMLINNKTIFFLLGAGKKIGVGIGVVFMVIIIAIAATSLGLGQGDCVVRYVNSDGTYDTNYYEYYTESECNTLCKDVSLGSCYFDGY